MELITIAGNIGKQPDLRRTQSGDDVLNFTVAVDQGKDRDGGKRPAKWFDCSLWGKRAASLEPYLSKGMKVALSGRVSARAHDGKAYLQISVDQLTMQGGGEERRDNRDGYQSREGYGGSPAGGAGAGGAPAMDDEIPFNCVRCV